MSWSSKGLSLCHIGTVRAIHTAVCWEMRVSQRGSTGAGESDLPSGHLRGRNPLGHISSIWLVLNCSAEASIIPYVTHIWMWQLSFGMCSSGHGPLTLPWTDSSIRPISSFRVVWIKHGHTNLMYMQQIWKSGVKMSFSKATSWEFSTRVSFWDGHKQKYSRISTYEHLYVQTFRLRSISAGQNCPWLRMKFQGTKFNSMLPLLLVACGV